MRLFFIVLAAVATACGGSSPGNPAAPSPIPSTSSSTPLTVYVLPMLLGLGEAGQAHANDSAVDLSTQTAWESSNPTVATVTSGGLVIARGSGQTQIRGQSQGRAGTFPLEVISGTDITEIILAGPSASVFLGQPLALSPRLVIRGNTIYDMDAGRAAWSTSDPRVVALGANGTMSTVSAGVATITATFLGKSGSTTVTVSMLEHDTFSVASESAAGRFAVDGRLSFSMTVAYSILSAPSGRVLMQIFDQTGRSLGSNPTVDVPAGSFKTATVTDELTVPAGTKTICTAATLTLPGQQPLHANGGCLTIG